MRPSPKALVDVATVMQADPAIPASALRNQLLEQVRVFGDRGRVRRVPEISRLKDCDSVSLSRVSTDTPGNFAFSPPNT